MPFATARGASAGPPTTREPVKGVDVYGPQEPDGAASVEAVPAALLLAAPPERQAVPTDGVVAEHGRSRRSVADGWRYRFPFVRRRGADQVGPEAVRVAA